MTPQTLAALGGLIPAAGALALLARSVARSRGRLPRSGRVTMPIEPPPPPARRTHRARRDPSPHPCDTCGTEIAGRETTCAVCERAALAAGRPGAGATLLHWLVFLAMMTAIIGAGYLASP